MEKAQPDEGMLELDLDAIKEEQWDALMEAQLSPDDLLAAVLYEWSEHESAQQTEDSYDYPSAEANDLYAAEDGEL